MGLWHGVEYYEKEKVVGEEFYQQWSNVSTRNLSVKFTGKSGVFFVKNLRIIFFAYFRMYEYMMCVWILKGYNNVCNRS